MQIGLNLCLQERIPYFHNFIEKQDWGPLQFGTPVKTKPFLVKNSALTARAQAALPALMVRTILSTSTEWFNMIHIVQAYTTFLHI